MIKVSRISSVLSLFVLVACALATAGLRDVPSWPVIITPSESSIYANQSINLTVGMNTTSSSATTVSLSSSAPQYLPVPSSMTIPANSSTGTVATPGNGTSPSSPTYVTITASVGTKSSQTTVLVQ